MALRFWRKKRSQLRGPDGKFMVADGSQDGSGSVAARGYARDLAQLKETFTAAADLHSSITNAALERLEQQRHFDELQDMSDDIEGSIEDSGDPFETALMKFLPILLQGGLKPNANADGSWGAPAGISPPIMSQEPSVKITSPDQEKAEGVDRLNQVLNALSKMPLDKVNESVVRKVAQVEGLDYEALKGTIRKLAPVVMKNG